MLKASCTRPPASREGTPTPERRERADEIDDLEDAEAGQKDQKSEDREDTQAPAASDATPEPEQRAGNEVESLVGRWENKEQQQPVVHGDQVLWDNGERWTIRAEGGARFSVAINGKTFKARRVNGDRLEWDDGDVWSRLPDKDAPG